MADKNKEKSKRASFERQRRYKAKQRALLSQGVTTEPSIAEFDKVAELYNKPLNFGDPDCMCKMCIGNRSKTKPHILNHGALKRCDQLGENELNRVSLPGDVDFQGAANVG